MLGWLVEQKQIEPHVPVWDKSERQGGTLSHFTKAMGFRVAAAASTLWRTVFRFGPWGLMRAPIVPSPGITSRSNSSLFCRSSTASVVAPVRFPPGRLRLVTSPCSTGSLPVTKTIGIVDVAALAGNPVGVPVAAIRSTLRRTRSSASPAVDRICLRRSGTRSPRSGLRHSPFPPSLDGMR